MANNTEALKALEVQFNQVIQSKFILSNQPIKNLLKCLAYYDNFVELINKSNNNFDYELELNKCINNSVPKSFELPTADSKIIPLVTCLLMDFDERDKNITEFIISYFPALTHNDSYQIFCDKVIIPYHRAIVDGVNSMQGKIIKDELSEADDKISLVSEGLLEKVQYLIEKLFDEIRTVGLSETYYADCKIVIETFLLAVESCDRRRIRGSWIGLKYTLKNVKTAQSYINKIKDALKLYLVI